MSYAVCRQTCIVGTTAWDISPCVGFQLSNVDHNRPLTNICMRGETKHAGRRCLLFSSIAPKIPIAYISTCKVASQCIGSDMVYAGSNSKYGFYRSVLGHRYLPGPFIKAHVLEHRASSITTDYALHLSGQTRRCNTAVTSLIIRRAYPTKGKCRAQSLLVSSIAVQSDISHLCRCLPRKLLHLHRCAFT